MRFTVRANDYRRQVDREARQELRDRRLAAKRTADRNGRAAQIHIRTRMRAVGLGRLGNAVGMKSYYLKGGAGAGAAIFARGQSKIDNRGAGAIEAYSQGAIIRARNAKWMAFATGALPRITNRKRMTPARYRSEGWESRLGKLEFKPISKSLAFYVVRNLGVSVKTGRAKRAPKRRSKATVVKREVTMFVLIKFTRRAQRFDEKEIAAIHAANMGRDFMEELARIQHGRGQR